jgi:hypothetical protein
MLCFLRVFHGKKKRASEKENFRGFRKEQYILSRRTGKTPSSPKTMNNKKNNNKKK